MVNRKIGKFLHEFVSEDKHLNGFHDTHFTDKKSISYDLFNNWDLAIKFIKDNKLYKWASLQQINNMVLDEIKQLIIKVALSQL